MPDRPTADTSVVVAALSTWHDHHAAALDAMRDVERLPAHAYVESASVLTRLPGGLAQPLGRVLEVLDRSFPGLVLTLPPVAHRAVAHRAVAHRAVAHRAVAATLAAAGLGGVALYDGLIAATAIHHGVPLLTLDRSVARTYLGARRRRPHPRRSSATGRPEHSRTSRGAGPTGARPLLAWSAGRRGSSGAPRHALGQHDQRQQGTHHGHHEQGQEQNVR